MDFNNTGAMRSPFSPRVRQSISGRRPIGLSSAKKNQSKFMQSASEQAGDVIYKTPLITVETHGLPLPVMVTEALTFGSGDVSVRMSECGWCWVVTGRRILVWPWSVNPDENNAPLPAGGLAARELTLPQTDLAHKADLVMVFYANGAQMPSCLGVSPEGVVRFWPSVGQEGVYVDVTCELAGQECERLAAVQGALVLATTTCTLVILSPATIDGRQTVSCHTLRPPSGWLGGIGRRVSLMFFGSMPAHAETKLVGVVGVGGSAVEPHVALVASGPVLQLWCGAALHEHHLRRALAAADAAEPGAAEPLALDVRACAGDLLLLLAAGGRYAVAHVSVADPARPRVVALAALRGWPAPPHAERPRFLPLDAHVVLYTPDCIALASSMVSNDKVDYVSVAAEGDRILGAELCGGVPLLFSRKHGVLLLSVAERAAPPDRSVCDSPMGSPCPSDMYDGNLSLFEIDPHEISTVTTDACGKLKTAFLFHLRRDAAAGHALLQELFPAPAAAAAPAEPDVDAVLDRTVLRIATEMLDDIPAGDPRWKQRAGGAATNIALGSSAALQVAAQLQDKKRAFSLFLDFLRAAGLWRRLGLLSAEGGGCIRTESALAALAEQLAAAVALRRLQQGGGQQVIDAAIFQVVCGSNPEVEEEPAVEEALASGALSPSDACYRRVSRITRVLRAVARAPADRADAPAAARHARAAIEVLTSVLAEMSACRAAWAGGAGAGAGALGPRALLPALLDLLKRAVTRYAHDCPAPALRGQLLEAAAALAAVVLADAEPLRRSPHTAHVYEAMRREAILPFVEEGQKERAVVLAEKFQDFELLVRLCVEGDEPDRLADYIDKYQAEGMAEIAYSWLAERGGSHAALLVRRLAARGGARLRAWLAAAPRRAPLAALHCLQAARPGDAARILGDMADEPAETLARCTTMASLGKLCLLAAEEVEPAGSVLWRRLEARLALAEQQAALPADIRRHHGLDGEDARVLAPEDLVQMYISSESGALTEFDYKKALDLTDFVSDMERRDDLRLRVWCACILRSSWAPTAATAEAAAAAAAGAAEAATEAAALHDKMFFRLVDLVHVMGGDLELVLPAAEDILTAPELAELASDPQFHYAVKYGYECVAALHG